MSASWASLLFPFSQHSGNPSSSRSSSHQFPPSMTQPPFPHPLPHRNLTIHFTEDGLVLRPSSPSQSSPSDEAETYTGKAAHISWGRQGKVSVRPSWSWKRERPPLTFLGAIGVKDDERDDQIRCSCLGVLGVLRLFHDSYLLVISSRRSVANLSKFTSPYPTTPASTTSASLDQPTQMKRLLFTTFQKIYSLTGVIAIPLNPEGAKAVIKQQSESQEKRRRESHAEDEGDDPGAVVTNSAQAGHVRFEKDGRRGGGDSGDTDDGGDTTSSEADDSDVEENRVPPPPPPQSQGQSLAPPAKRPSASRQSSTLTDISTSTAVTSDSNPTPEQHRQQQRRLSLRPRKERNIGRLFWRPGHAASASSSIGEGEGEGEGEKGEDADPRQEEKKGDVQDVAAARLANSDPPQPPPGSSSDQTFPQPAASNTSAATGSGSGAAGPDADVLARQQFDAKVVRECVREMRSGAFYFSYGMDITRGFGAKFGGGAGAGAGAGEGLEAEGEGEHEQKVQQDGGSGNEGKRVAKTTVPPKNGDQGGRDGPGTASAAVAGSNGGGGGGSVLEEPSQNVPLWKRADKRFWWNSFLMKDFVEAGLHDFVYVLMQGFVQERHFDLPLPRSSSILDVPSSDAAAETTSGSGTGTPGSLPSSSTDSTATTTSSSSSSSKDDSVPLDLMIISRRGIERPGLRYQRRGINDEGGVANFVETEFVVRAERAGKCHVASYVQTRGSIPLFWSQSPWNLKPIPVLERTPEENLAACKEHFDAQIRRYGKQVIVNLAEQHGKEGVVVNAYKERVAEIATDDIKYVDWDFHTETKGMKYENILRLVEKLSPDLNDLRFFWATSSQVLATQKGVCRTNCMDCLDRTNVVQSALAKYMLNSQLVNLGITTLREVGKHEQLDLVFNELWANNGDAISREYAGTSALKGDFVRSGKRNWRGMVNDASNSLARLWQNVVSDFFKQSMIDYVLGINLGAFTEYQQRMETRDPGEILRLARIRSVAIETASSHVLSEGESRLAGWTLLSPSDPNCRTGEHYEERVVLLSDKALYSCSYEYHLQKVREFVRIPYGEITGIQTGEYILSALEESARDREQNYGFVISYGTQSATSFVHTYSMRNKPKEMASEPDASGGLPGEIKICAFKAMRKDMVKGAATVEKDLAGDKSCRLQVLAIVARIREECEKVGATEPGDEDFVKEAPVVSLADAQASTSLLTRLNYNLKHLIWL